MVDTVLYIIQGNLLNIIANPFPHFCFNNKFIKMWIFGILKYTYLNPIFLIISILYYINLWSSLW